MSDAPELDSAEPVLIRETGFLNRTVTLAHRRYHYQVYVPRSYTVLESWPLILFLHGAGERGEDGLRQTQIGLAAAIRCHVERFPAIVAFPQALTDASWNTAEMSELAIAAMQQAMRDFRVDPRRVYLTGLSMGGTGVWSIAARHPGLFAALAPICGALHFPAGKVAQQPHRPVLHSARIMPGASILPRCGYFMAPKIRSYRSSMRDRWQKP